VTLAGIIIEAIGALGAAVAAVAAWRALKVARDSAADLERAANASAEAVSVAERARGEAEAGRRQERRDTERARERERLVRLGELVEELYRMVTHASDRVPGMEPWMALRNVIGQALIGLRSPLPECKSIAGASRADMEIGPTSRARFEITQALEALDRGTWPGRRSKSRRERP